MIEVDIKREDWIQDKLDPDLRTLEIGAQDGWLLAPLGIQDLVSVDIDLYDYPGFVRADAHELPFLDNDFKQVVMAEVLEHVRDPVRCLMEARRVGDRLYSTIPNESKWHPDAEPFGDPDKKAERYGMDRAGLAKMESPKALEITSEDNYDHLWHQRYYDEGMIRDHFSQAGWKIEELDNLEYDGFAFFVVVAERGNDA